MTLALGSVTIDGFELRFRRAQQVLDADGVEWPLTEFTGWGGPVARTERSPRPTGQHGSFRGRAARSERIIGVRFLAILPDGDMGPTLWRRIAGLCSDPGRLYPLTVDDQTDLTADVELDDEVLLQWLTPTVIECSVQFAAPDPRLHGAWVQRETPLPTFTGGGLNATAPGLSATAPGLSAGVPGEPGIVVVPNGGTTDTSPVIELVGPLTSPQITARETGQVLDLSLEVPTAQSLWINTGDFPALGLPARSVLLDGASSRRRYLFIANGWPLIGAGKSVTFSLRASGYSAAARMRIHSRDAWW